jgi:uncharacterized PurR-regulated membrane protein YhhQ (DUF165 family)
LIGLYIVLIVAANLSVAFFGPQFAILNSIILIGPDFTIRDSLHERWHGHGLAWRMAALIASGSILSAALAIQALPIAVASFAAFACSGAADTIVYALLGDRARFVKMNGSNIVSTSVDSVVFSALAFGLPLMIPIVIGQILAKIFGGFVLSWALTRRQAAPALATR